MGFAEDDPAPSYEESCANHYSTRAKSTPSRQYNVSLPEHFLTATLANVQQQRIREIIESTIEPLLVSQMQHGLCKSTFALIPSDVEGLQNRKCTLDVHEDVRHSEGGADAEEMVVGFPDNEHVTLVRLVGQENNLRFWQQPNVLDNLNAGLRKRLNIPDEVAQQLPVPASSASMPSKRRPFGSRQNSVKKQPAQQSPFDHQIPRVMQTPGSRLTLTLELGEIWLRRMTAMGLYETTSGRAILIRSSHDISGG